MYLFIVILLLFNNKPVLIQTKKKKNGKKKLLGFKIYLTIFEIYSIILIYFPILDLITKVENKLNGLYTNIIFDSFPLIYEVEKLCELNTLYIDYIYDYKMVWSFKFSLNNDYMNECLIRFLKLPFTKKQLSSKG